MPMTLTAGTPNRSKARRVDPQSISLSANSTRNVTNQVISPPRYTIPGSRGRFGVVPVVSRVVISHSPPASQVRPQVQGGEQRQPDDHHELPVQTVHFECQPPFPGEHAAVRHREHYQAFQHHGYDVPGMEDRDRVSYRAVSVGGPVVIEAAEVTPLKCHEHYGHARCTGT